LDLEERKLPEMTKSIDASAIDRAIHDAAID